MHIQHSKHARPNPIPSVEKPLLAPATASPDDFFERTLATRFVPARDGVQVMGHISQAFAEGIQRIKNTAARQPTTADLTAAKGTDRRRAACPNKSMPSTVYLTTSPSKPSGGFGHKPPSGRPVTPQSDSGRKPAASNTSIRLWAQTRAPQARPMGLRPRCQRSNRSRSWA